MRGTLGGSALGRALLTVSATCRPRARALSVTSEWALPPSWAAALRGEAGQPYFKELVRHVSSDRSRTSVLPAADDQFAAFAACPFEEVRVVILGQEPHATAGAAHGLSFSVTPNARVPGLVRNMYRELQNDLGVPVAPHGCLQGWASQGVLLLNAVLTVREGAPGSHSGLGWERLTDAALEALSTRRRGVVFLLWGAAAQKKGSLVDGTAHCLLRASHPSPLSARGGFFGCRHFSLANRYLCAAGQPPVDWSAHLDTPELLRPVHPPLLDQPVLAASSPAGELVASTASVTSEPPPPPPPDSPARAADTGSTTAAAPTALHEEPSEPRGAAMDARRPVQPQPQPTTGAAAVPAAALELPPPPATSAASPSSGRGGGGVDAGAPHQWWKTMAAIERARASRDAPVDYLGCHTLGEHANGEEVFRFQTLVALVLSSRTSDGATATAMQRLRVLTEPFGGLTAAGLSKVLAIDDALVTRAIEGTTYAGQKSARLAQMTRLVLEEHGGDTPRQLRDLLALPGVGPKVAHLFLQVAYDDAAGIAVDTHVHRIAGRLGWTRGAKSAEDTRKQLEAWLPAEHWASLNPLLVGFGQQTCTATAPRCAQCPLSAKLCPRIM